MCQSPELRSLILALTHEVSVAICGYETKVTPCPYDLDHPEVLQRIHLERKDHHWWDHEIQPHCEALAGKHSDSTVRITRVSFFNHEFNNSCYDRDHKKKCVKWRKKSRRYLPTVNHKRMYRIMSQNGLLMPCPMKRPSKTHDGKIITLKSDLRWCTDTFGLKCWNGDLVQVAFVLDCHDREIITWIASSKGITGKMIQDLMTEAVEKRFPKSSRLPRKIQWLSDNGPCYAARETVEFGRQLGFEICTTAPYSPESNGIAEAFVETFKRDYGYVNDLKYAEDVLKQLSAWFEDYNTNAPHKGLKMMSPREYRAKVSAV